MLHDRKSEIIFLLIYEVSFAFSRPRVLIARALPLASRVMRVCLLLIVY